MNIAMLFVVFVTLLAPGQGFSADSTSFNPTTVSITSQGAIPVGTVITWSSSTNPPDMAKWLECNGQAVPSGSQYAKLRSVLGTGKPVPNYNDQFLRGTTTLAEVGKTFSDTLKSHSHYVEPHQHTVSGTSSGQSYSGTIAGQQISGTTSGQNYSGTIAAQRVSGTTSGQNYSGTIAGQQISGTTSGQNYSGTIAAQRVTGTTSGQQFSGSTSVTYVKPEAGITAASMAEPYGLMSGVFATSTGTATGTVTGTTQGGTFDGYTTATTYSGKTQAGTFTGNTAASNYSGTTQGGTFDGYTTATTYSGKTQAGTFSGTTSNSYYAGTTSGGTISGFTNEAGGGYSHNTGDSETAPKHIKVRYLIRAIP